ncbi:vWA domain-containing protein [Prosthecomicrobium pneumaticum]|uniref:Ca-activated chloride channel family protein n=1 Tax=Prosthecomicrobium pneumaticum TaxID=81895 RepID=A0A7W9FPA9_9HYPH|nr:VWA domain-containing protein [Prosthecomicrobium pneumaticum]MBB5754278.1 Ca-activated chloride channel family protein [Prosthecomicrobium pneumaticum]
MHRRLLFLPVLLALAAPAAANDAMVVLDVSASMSGKLGGTAKMALAVEAVETAVAGFPADSRLGLVAYGSKSSKSCSDVEMLVPPALDAAERIGEAAQDLKPRGRAPLAIALQRAAEAIDYTKQRATIVVIADAIEPCDADPCALAAALKEKGKDLAIHVVGLGLKPGEEAGLSCVAEATGGRFVNAIDGADVTGGLGAALASAKAPPRNLPFASIEAPDSVFAGATFTIGYDGPKAADDRLQITWPDQPVGSEVRAAMVGKDAKPRRLMAPAEAAVYELRYYSPSREAVLATRSITVSLPPVTLDAPASGAAGSEIRVGWTGPAGPEDRIVIVPAAGGPSVATAPPRRDGLPVRFTLPLAAGRFEIRYMIGGDTAPAARRAFTVEPPAATVAGPATVAAGSLFEVTLSGPAARFDDIVVARPGAPTGEHVTASRVRPRRDTLRLRAPAEPGAYELRYVAGDGGAVFARAPIVVK